MKIRDMLLILSYAVSYTSGNPVNEVYNRFSQLFYRAGGSSHQYISNGKNFEEKHEMIQSELAALKASYEELSRKKRGTFVEDDSIGKLMGFGNSFAGSKGGNSICSTCITVVSFLKFLIEDGSTDEELIELAMLLAESMHIMTPEICHGMLMGHGVSLVHILRITTLSCGEICNLVVGAKCEEPDVNREWRIQIPESKKPKVFDIQLPPEDAPKLKVLLISDTHVDPFYVEGTWAECTLPICCRAEIGEPTPNATLSGKWGGWRCDTPWRTLENLFEHLVEEHPDIDYIVWTGDLNPHDMWSFHKNDSIAMLKKMVALFAKYFPNTPCYPALGNHEADPANLFPTVEVESPFEINWLYDELAKQWSRWLPEGCAKPIRRGGFYTVLVKPGFRIISLNTNICYSDNWWLLVNDKDPLDELKWLVEILQSAEENNEKVHIIGHVPPAYAKCIKIWQTNYLKILCRYENIITAQFFGHTHKDEFELNFDPEDVKRACGVSFTIPSVTTYPYLNPGYQIAYVDGDHDKTTRRVLDFISYIFDLEKANECDDFAKWTKLYSAKEAYNMTSLLPSDWKLILDRIATDDIFLQLYHKHVWKNSPARPSCDEDRRTAYIRRIYSYAQYGDYTCQT